MALEFANLARGDSYKDYISQQYFKEDMNIVIAKNVREAVGSIEDICQRNTNQVKEGLTDIQCRIDKTNENLEIISFGLERIEDTLDVINSNIVSGFQALFVKVDEINAQLAHLRRGVDTLVEIARTPVQTWAFNQYEIARDEIRRKLFPEALEALDLAINGNEQHTGYKTDYRFHHLRGVLLLGIPGESETVDLVDLVAAEQAFLLASRYSRHDNSTEAAQALVGAGKAAYAHGRLEVAYQHYFEALRIDERCGEANYQLARLSVHRKDSEAIQHYLCAAFDIHWSFAMRAAEDILFSGMPDLIERCVRSSTHKIVEEIRPVMGRVVSGIKFMKAREISPYRIDNLREHTTLLTNIGRASEALKVRRLKDIFDVRSNVPSTLGELQNLAANYVSILNGNRERIISQGTSDVVEVNPEAVATTISIIVGAVILLAGVIVFINIFNQDAGKTKSSIEYVIWLVICLIFIGIPGAIVFSGGAALAGWISFFITSNVSEEANRNRRVRQNTANESLTKKNSAFLQQRLEEIKSYFDSKSE